MGEVCVNVVVDNWHSELRSWVGASLRKAGAEIFFTKRWKKSLTREWRDDQIIDDEEKEVFEI